MRSLSSAAASHDYIPSFLKTDVFKCFRCLSLCLNVIMSDSVDSSVCCQRQWQQVVCVFAASLVESVGLSSFSISQSNYWSHSLLGCVLYLWCDSQTAVSTKETLSAALFKGFSSAGGETESGIFTFVFLLDLLTESQLPPPLAVIQRGRREQQHISQPPSTQQDVFIITSPQCAEFHTLNLRLGWIHASRMWHDIIDYHGPGRILHNLLVFMVQSYYFYAHFEFVHHRISQEVLQETKLRLNK